MRIGINLSRIHCRAGDIVTVSEQAVKKLSSQRLMIRGKPDPGRGKARNRSLFGGTYEFFSKTILIKKIREEPVQAVKRHHKRQAVLVSETIDIIARH